MCLTVDFKKTLKAKSRKNKYVTRYKILKLLDENLVSPNYMDTIWKAGWNKSNARPLKKLPKRIYRGVHVYTAKMMNEKVYAAFFGSIKVEVPVRCYTEDLIAAGDDEEVYRKVFVSEEILKDYLRLALLKKRKKKCA